MSEPARTEAPVAPESDERVSLAGGNAVDDLTDTRRPRRFVRGACSFGLSLFVHAVLIGAVVWLIGLPEKHVPAKPIRVTLLASVAPVKHASAPVRAPVNAAPRVKPVKKAVAPPHPVRHPRRPRRRKIVRKHVIVRRAKPAPKKRKVIRKPKREPLPAVAPRVTVAATRPPAHANAARSKGPPLAASSVAHPPRILRKVLPHYPLAARLRGLSGRVLLEVILGRNGDIRRIKVLHSIPLLDEAAMRAVRRWRFSPARDAEGRTVSVTVDIPVIFRLQG